MSIFKKSYMKQLYTLVIAWLFSANLVFAQTKTLTKAEYRDKTLAMVLGSIAGVATGYEYLNHFDTPDGFYKPGATQSVPKMPLLGLPEDWYIPMNGTLGGTTKDEHNYGSWFRGGKMYSDDDQHIDFFNQFLLNQYGASISYEDIKHEWMSKEVSDFGGGQGAIEVMRDKNLMAPQCGQGKHGNGGHWLPECYIEHETMGAAFPGMPNKSMEFTDKFSRLTGEGEVVTWGYYWSAAHALAFFETDIRVALKKAVDVMPGNSRVRQMYDICVELNKQYPNDWRAAVRVLWKDHWRAPFAVEYDKVMMLGDVNNGTGMLSILYGNNDYTTTLKIACLAGGDGDCTASAVGGLLGIIKGMAGTPAVYKDAIYNNGKGRWVNEVAHAFSVKKDYPIEFTYDQIVDMYQQNAETMIRAFGGTVTTTGYTIKTQTGIVPKIASANWDFEQGDLSGWKTWKNGGNSSVWCERQCNDNTQACYAATGHYKGTVLTESNTSEAKLYQTITGLKPGATYKIEGRINTAAGREARFYAENYGGAYQYTSFTMGNSTFPFLYLYVTMGKTNTTLDVGLHAVATTNGGKWCSIDDIVIRELETFVKPVRYEAEVATINNGKVYNSATASNGKYVGSLGAEESYIEFSDVMAGYTGEYILRINHINAGTFAKHKIFVNGNFIGLLEHINTGPFGQFSSNVTDAHVKLRKGSNVVRIAYETNAIDIDFVDLVSHYGSEGKPADGTELVDGGIYKVVAKHSQKVLDIDGLVANGSAMVQNEYTGASTQFFKVTKVKNLFYLSPLKSEQSVEILGQGLNNGDKVGLWGYWGGEGQQWAIIDAKDNGYFKIINNRSGKAMDVSGGKKDDGIPVFQWEYLNGDNQKWKFDFVGTNPDILPHKIPGIVQAEGFSDAYGIKAETTTDAGGGSNIAFIEHNDWAEYSVDVKEGGNYDFIFRVASATTGGKIRVKIDDNLLGEINVGNTNGWQSWKDVQTSYMLSEGTHTLRLEFKGDAGSLFNVNYIKASPSVITGIGTNNALNARVYPNPSAHTFIIEEEGLFDYVIFNVAGEKIEGGTGENFVTVGETLKPGMYIVRIGKDTNGKFAKVVKH